MSVEDNKVSNVAEPVAEKHEFVSDYVLVSLVDFCNNSSLEIGISLYVGGSVITGILISGKSYADAVASKMEESGVKALADWFRNFGEETFGPESSISEDIPEMIHLKEAKIFDGTVTHYLGWWRGRIKSVDGHCVGQMSRNV